MTTRHISDIDTWGAADRNYYVFLVLTFIFGFFGFDHFYLRSFGTGFQKLIMNIFGLGFWYIWDIIQVTTEADKVRSEGLNSPFDWIRGIGRGVFQEKLSGGGGDPTSKPEKSYLVYAFLAICFGWLGADKFYLGKTLQGFAKLFSCFNIFIFLFGWLWVAWDAFHAFFMTDSILKDGIHSPLPYSYFFNKTPSNIFIGGQTNTSASQSGFFDFFTQFSPMKFFEFITQFLPSVPNFSGVGKEVKELLPLLATPPIVRTLEAIETKIPTMPTSAAMPEITMPTSAMPTSAMPTSAMPTSAMPTSAMYEPAMPTSAIPVSQSGGGMTNSNTGPIIAGVLTAIIMVGGFKGTYDFIRSTNNN